MENYNYLWDRWDLTVTAWLGTIVQYSPCAVTDTITEYRVVPHPEPSLTPMYVWSNFYWKLHYDVPSEWKIINHANSILPTWVTVTTQHITIISPSLTIHLTMHSSLYSHYRILSFWKRKCLISSSYLFSMEEQDQGEGEKKKKKGLAGDNGILY